MKTTLLLLLFFTAILNAQNASTGSATSNTNCGMGCTQTTSGTGAIVGLQDNGTTVSTLPGRSLAIGNALSVAGLPTTTGNAALVGGSTTPVTNANYPTTSWGAINGTLANAVQWSAMSWTGGTVTLTIRSGQTENWVVGQWINVNGATSTGPGNLNGIFQVTAANSTSVSYALATNPGTNTSPSYPIVALEAEMELQAKSPFGTALFLSGNPFCVVDGNDIGAFILAIAGPGGQVGNSGWGVGCDGHSWTGYSGGILQAFVNAVVESYTSNHVYGWTSAADGSKSPINSGNVDLSFARLGPGAMGVNNSASAGMAGTLQAGVTATDPGCTTTAHIGKQWYNITTTTTVYQVCLSVAGTVAWVTK